jgi:hypothetical protein
MPMQNHYGGRCENCAHYLPEFANMIFMDGHLEGVNQPARTQPLQHHARRWSADYHWSCSKLNNMNKRSKGVSGVLAAGKRIVHSPDGSAGDLNCDMISRWDDPYPWPW